jgi:hypothetical protein
VALLAWIGLSTLSGCSSGAQPASSATAAGGATGTSTTHESIPTTVPPPPPSASTDGREVVPPGLPVEPNPTLTPGAVLPVTTEDICISGYTKKARRVSSADKRAVFEQDGLTDAGHWTTTKNGRAIWRSDFEVDHLIPLELGGSNAMENLWAENYLTSPWNAHVKDKLENKLHRMVCMCDITLAEAQRAVATDWIAAYKRYVGDDVGDR